VLQQYPGKFVGCLLADPTPGGGGAAAIEQLAKEHGYRAVRFNPYLWPEGEKMTNEVTKGWLQYCADLWFCSNSGSVDVQQMNHHPANRGCWLDE
jgi:predicted TIM-barrel fold metal-dependent hydrolase